MGKTNDKNQIESKSVFVSWNSKQKEIKNQICIYLNTGLSGKDNKRLSFEGDEEPKYYTACWDSDKNCFGDIKPACESAVKVCNVFLIIVSDTAIASAYVKDEVECAKEHLNRNYIVPVYLDTKLTAENRNELSGLASGIHVYELTDDELIGEKNLERILQKVQVALNEHIYSDYLVVQSEKSASIMGTIKNYSENFNAEQFDFKSLYVDRKVLKAKGGESAADGEEYTARQLIEASENAPVLIYGKSGTGKSMFINKMVCEMLAEISANRDEDGYCPLIFIVSLGDFAAAGCDLIDYLCQIFKSGGVFGTYTAEIFRSLLLSKNSTENKRGNIRIFFDATDEIIAQNSRENAWKKINNFCTTFTNTKIIFTSRNYDSEFVLNAVSGNSFTAFCLDQFNEVQFDEFIKNIFEQLAGGGALENGRSGQAFKEAVADIDARIKRNPFILTQLVFMYNKDGAEKLPKTLAGIYGQTMDYYIKRDKDKTLNKKISKYEVILAHAAYFKFIDDGDDSFENIFKDLRGKYGCADDGSYDADEAYNFFTARSVINNRTFFFQIFHDYYAAKHIFSQFGTDDRRGCKFDKKYIEYLRDDLAQSSEKWSEVCKILLSMIEDKWGEKPLVQTLDILCADERNCDLLFETAASVLTKCKLTAQYALINAILARTASGEFGWYEQLCYYVPAYGLYAPFARAVAEYDGENKRKAMCVLRDICFIYGAFDGVDEVADIPQKTVDMLKSLCREVYADDIAAFKAGKPFDARAALNITFYLGLTFGGERQPQNPRFDGDICPEYVVFEGENYPVENIINNFVAAYPREFCVLHAINRRSEVEVDRPEKQLFDDSEGLFKPCDFSESGYIGLCFVPYEKEKIEANFTAEKASRVTGLVLLPSSATELEYIEFNKGNLFYYSFPDNITALKSYCFNFCRDISYLFISGDVKTIEQNCFTYIQKLYLYLESSTRWRTIEQTDNLNAALYKLKCTSLKKIWEFAFANNKLLILTSLPENISKICKGAFSGCTELKLVRLPNKLRHIGILAFSNCSSLALTNLPKSVEVIEGGAFEGCTSMALESLPNNLRTIDSGAFENCRLLALSSLPESVEKIGPGAFKNCASLKLTCLPKNLSEIENSTFEGCSSLSLETLPLNIEEICWNAFYGCPEKVTKLKDEWYDNHAITIEIPEGTEEVTCAMIGEIADNYRCEQDLYIRELPLKVVLPNSIKEIGANAFSYCKFLMLNLPSGVKKIGAKAFVECQLLESELPNGLKSIGREAFAGCKSLRLKNGLPESLEYIGGGAFYGCSSLTITSLPKNLKVIEVNAFDYWSTNAQNLVEQWQLNHKHIKSDIYATMVIPEHTLHVSGGDWLNGLDSHYVKEIIFPDSVKIIDRRAFEEYTSLVQKSGLPPKLEKIEYSAFSGCKDLAIEKLPESLKEIDAWAFGNCTSLELKHGLPSRLEKIEQAVFTFCEKLALPVLPENFTTITAGLFIGCKSLKLKDGLPSCIEDIGESAFELCESLVLPCLPDSVKMIGNSAFVGCTSLALTSLPEGLAEIGYSAFAGCVSLALTSLPKNLKIIDDGVFHGCVSITISGIPKDVTYIGESAFEGCTSITVSEIPEMVEEIGESAFAGCTSITVSKISEKVEKIGMAAFKGCTSITEMSIPKSVMVIGDGAFEGCPLKKVTMPKNFERDIGRIFGDIDKKIITFI